METLKQSFIASQFRAIIPTTAAILGALWNPITSKRLIKLMACSFSSRLATTATSADVELLQLDALTAAVRHTDTASRFTENAGSLFGKGAYPSGIVYMGNSSDGGATTGLTASVKHRYCMQSYGEVFSAIAPLYTPRIILNDGPLIVAPGEGFGVRVVAAAASYGDICWQWEEENFPNGT